MLMVTEELKEAINKISNELSIFSKVSFKKREEFDKNYLTIFGSGMRKGEWMKHALEKEKLGEIMWRKRDEESGYIYNYMQRIIVYRPCNDQEYEWKYCREEWYGNMNEYDPDNMWNLFRKHMKWVNIFEKEEQRKWNRIFIEVIYEKFGEKKDNNEEVIELLSNEWLNDERRLWDNQDIIDFLENGNYYPYWIII